MSQARSKTAYEQEKLVIPPLSKKESSICDKLDVLISMDEGGQTFV